MDDHERAALKAACIQAAAILIAPQAQPSRQPTLPPFGGRGVAPASPASTAEPDTGACARYARDLYNKLTGEVWEDGSPARAVPTAGAELPHPR